jgi:hypothetical protein
VQGSRLEHDVEGRVNEEDEENDFRRVDAALLHGDEGIEKAERICFDLVVRPGHDDGLVRLGILDTVEFTRGQQVSPDDRQDDQREKQDKSVRNLAETVAAHVDPPLPFVKSDFFRFTERQSGLGNPAAVPAHEARFPDQFPEAFKVPADKTAFRKSTNMMVVTFARLPAFRHDPRSSR